MKKWILLFSICISFVIGLMACSVGGGNETPTGSQTLTGRFVDSPVANLGYRTASKSGRTGTNGEYLYLAGETVIFSIGAIEFPPIPAASVVTPMAIFSSLNTTDTRVVNLTRLLLTLDTDGNPNNGITISNAAYTAATAAIDFSSPSFDADVASLVANGGGSATLVSPTSATSHLSYNLHTVGSTWTYLATEQTSTGTSTFTLSKLITQSSSTAYSIIITVPTVTTDYFVQDLVLMPNGAWGEAAYHYYDANNNALPRYDNYSPAWAVWPSSFSIGYHETGLSTGTHETGTINFLYDIHVIGFEFVTVPAGTFYALKISSTGNASGDNNYTDNLWIVNGIGVVKTLDSDNFKLELQSFTTSGTTSPTVLITGLTGTAGVTVTARHPADVDNSSPIAQTTSTGANGAFSLSIPSGSDFYLNYSGTVGTTQLASVNSKIWRNITSGPDLSQTTGEALSAVTQTEIDAVFNNAICDGSPCSTTGITGKGWLCMDTDNSPAGSNHIGGVSFTFTPTPVFFGYNNDALAGNVLIPPPTLTQTVAGTVDFQISSACASFSSSTIVTVTASKSGLSNQIIEFPVIPGQITYKEVRF